MSNHDDFWTTLATGHSNTVLAGAMDSHLTGKSLDGSFGSVRTLTDRHRAANALDLPVTAGTKVVFAGGLGAYMTYDDVPADGSTGEVVTVKSATGEITHHDGKVFVKWADGKFRPIHTEHLRLVTSGKTAAPRGKAQKALMEYIKDFPAEHREELSDVTRHPSFRGVHFAKVMSAAEALAKQGFLGWDGSAITKTASIRVASLGDLTQFLKRADGKLIHKSTDDLWSYSKDADGNFLVSRLFDDEGEPLKA